MSLPSPTPSATPRGHRVRRGAALLGAALTAASALVAASPATAGAADSVPTEQELLSQCGKADYCKFHTDSLTKGLVGEKHQVGGAAYNCGGTVHRTLTWSETTGATTNASITASLASALWEPISVSVSATLGKSVEEKHTTSVSVDYTMEPYTKFWITRGTGYQIIEGDWELHFGTKFHGHYYWYDNGYQTKVEDPDGGWEAYNYTPMTDAEVKSHCNTTSPKGRGKTTVTHYLRGVEGNRNDQWEYVKNRGPAYVRASS
ncbi:hypothetical protein ACIRU8_06620 [Streptomyces sp. NPDC101175]|uniref:hypothetical protein n=1 Tax=Streptomyces sp. NPDC101175 TaxID=3366123 RepID=UPI003837390D